MNSLFETGFGDLGTDLSSESALARRIVREERCLVVGLLLSSNLQANRVQWLMALGIMGNVQVVMGSRRTHNGVLNVLFFPPSFSLVLFFFFLFRFCSADFARLQRLVTCELGMYFQNYKIPPRATLIITFVRLGCLGRVFEVLFWKSSKTFDERFLFSEMSSNLQSLRIFFLIFSK